jgi:hypothetical protein
VELPTVDQAAVGQGFRGASHLKATAKCFQLLLTLFSGFQLLLTLFSPLRPCRAKRSEAQRGSCSRPPVAFGLRAARAFSCCSRCSQAFSCWRGGAQRAPAKSFQLLLTLFSGFQLLLTLPLSLLVLGFCAT